MSANAAEQRREPQRSYCNRACEFAGRRAGVGYCDVEIGFTRAPFAPQFRRAGKYLGGELRPCRIAGRSHVEDAAKVRIAWSFEQVAANGNDAVGDIERIRRRPVLVRHDGDFVAVLREAQHRPDEVFPEGRVDPRGAQNDVVGSCLGDRALAGEFRGAVDAERVCRMVLAIGARALPSNT